MKPMTHPVQLSVERPARTQRIHVLTRSALLLAFGALGCSSIYWALYIVLPAVVAFVVSKRGAERYLATDAPRIARVLRWFASAYGYLWLLTDVLPTAQGSPIDLQIAPSGSPTPMSALLRLVYSVPALLLVVALSVAAGLAWLVGAAAILVSAQIPGAIADFLVMALRVRFRLAAYHLSLVECYPSLEGSRFTRAVASRYTGSPPVA